MAKLDLGKPENSYLHIFSYEIFCSCFGLRSGTKTLLLLVRKTLTAKHRQFWL